MMVVKHAAGIFKVHMHLEYVNISHHPFLACPAATRQHIICYVCLPLFVAMDNLFCTFTEPACHHPSSPIGCNLGKQERQPGLMDGWKAIEAGLNALLSGPEACMKGPQLLMFCSAVQHQTRSSTPAGSSALDCVRCFIKTMQLLAKLLSDPKYAQCWAQHDYSSRVSTALAAATAVLKHPSLHVNPVAAGKMAKRLLGDTRLLLYVAAAQHEVAQLLAGPTHGRQAKGHDLLPQLAQQLLLWWLEAQRLWLHNPDRDALGRASTVAVAGGYYAYHMQAVELAAAVVQSAGHNCPTEDFLIVAEVKGLLHMQRVWTANRNTWGGRVTTQNINQMLRQQVKFGPCTAQ
jgi:hypothetical protein